MKTINLETEVIRENTRVLEAESITLAEQAKLDAEVNKVLETADASYREGIMSDLGFDYKLAEAVKIKQGRDAYAHLPQNRIMGKDAIKAICVKHGLRFLPTRFYKGALDSGIGAKLEEFRTANGGKLPVCGANELVQDGQGRINTAGIPQFYIAAPSESFVLQPAPRDPLLFCRLSEDKFFLLHKWGADLERDGKPHGITERNWNSVFTAAMDFASNLLQTQQAIMQAAFANQRTNTSPITVSIGNSDNMGQWFSGGIAAGSNNSIGFAGSSITAAGTSW